MIRFLAACSLIIAATCAPAVESIPADCRWVVSLDVQAITASKMGGWIKEQLGKQQVAAQLRILNRITGLDPTKDLKRVTLCAATGGDATGLMLVRGTFDQELITAAAEAAENHRTVSAGSRTIHLWADKGKDAAGCFAAADLLVLGRTAERVGQALAAIDAGAALAIPIPAGWETSALSVAAAEGLDSLAGQGPQSALLKNFSSLAARLSESGDELVLEAMATATGEPQAQQLLDAGNGLRAFLQLQPPAGLDRSLIESLRTAQFGREGAKLNLRMTLPVADAKRLADQKRNGG